MPTSRVMSRTASKALRPGDNYNASNTDAVAAAMTELKHKFHARKVVLAGHSGGAAISANILGRHAGIVDAALLVSCPCDVREWRKHMFEKTHNSVFQGPIDTLSPNRSGGPTLRPCAGYDARWRQ